MSTNSEDSGKNKKFDGGSLGVCIALGVAFGAAFDNVGLGVALGTAIGAAMGFRRLPFSKKNKNDS